MEQPVISIITRFDGVVVQVIGKPPYIFHKVESQQLWRLGIDAIVEQAKALYAERERNRNADSQLE